MSVLAISEPRGTRNFHDERARELLERALAEIYGSNEVVPIVSEALANLCAHELSDDERTDLRDLAESEAA